MSVQDKMDDFLATAALEKRPGVEATFTWLRRRGVRICLLSDYDRHDTALLLKRLKWTVDVHGTVHNVITQQLRQTDPVQLAIAQAGLKDANLSFTVFDTPRLLELSNLARVHFNLALCNGRHSYTTLAAVPHHAMLDSLLQLPDFILRHLPLPTKGAGPQVPTHPERQSPVASRDRTYGRNKVGLPRLRLPNPLSGL